MTQKSPSEPPAVSNSLPAGRQLQAIEWLTRLSATLFECASSVLLFNQAGVSRVVCGCGQVANSEHMSYRWDYKDAPYSPDERFILTDALKSEFIQSNSPFSKERIGFLVRTPIEAAGDHTFTLIVYDHDPRPVPEPSQIKLLDEIVQLV